MFLRHGEVNTARGHTTITPAAISSVAASTLWTIMTGNLLRAPLSTFAANDSRLHNEQRWGGLKVPLLYGYTANNDFSWCVIVHCLAFYKDMLLLYV